MCEGNAHKQNDMVCPLFVSLLWVSRPGGPRIGVQDHMFGSLFLSLRHSGPSLAGESRSTLWFCFRCSARGPKFCLAGPQNVSIQASLVAHSLQSRFRASPSDQASNINFSCVDLLWRLRLMIDCGSMIQQLFIIHHGECVLEAVLGGSDLKADHQRQLADDLPLPWGGRQNLSPNQASWRVACLKRSCSAHLDCLMWWDLGGLVESLSVPAWVILHDWHLGSTKADWKMFCGSQTYLVEQRSTLRGQTSDLTTFLKLSCEGS